MKVSVGAVIGNEYSSYREEGNMEDVVMSTCE